MGRVTNVDRLFALKALETRIAEERKDLECECRKELLGKYFEDGTDRMASPYFGPDAGKFSIKHYKATPDSTVRTFKLADDEAFAEWCEDNVDSLVSYAKSHVASISEWMVGKTGELPDGTAFEDTHVPGKPEVLSAQVYSFKSDTVLDKLAQGGNILEGANRLLLGDGE